VPRKRSNCRVFAQRPSPIVPRSGSLREPMRGHCGARLIGVATGTTGQSSEARGPPDVWSNSAGRALRRGRPGAVPTLVPGPVSPQVQVGVRPGLAPTLVPGPASLGVGSRPGLARRWFPARPRRDAGSRPGCPQDRWHWRDVGAQRPMRHRTLRSAAGAALLRR